MREDPVIGVDERELDDLALEALAEAHAATPPSGLRTRVLGALQHEVEVARLRRAHARWRMVGAVAAGLVLLQTGLLMRAMRHGAELEQLAARRGEQVAALTKATADLGTRIETQERTLIALRESIATQAHVLQLVGGPRVVTAALAPQGGITAGARVAVDRSSGEATIIVSNIDPPGEGKTYELWAIRGGNPPEPAGLFTVGSDRWAAARMPRIERPSEVTAFAVSIEPAAGSTSPTGPIVLVGAIAS